MFVTFEDATKNVFCGIERHKRITREKKHDQTVLRKEDEWLLSIVIQNQSGECLKQRSC